MHSLQYLYSLLAAGPLERKEVSYKKCIRLKNVGIYIFIYTYLREITYLRETSRTERPILQSAEKRFSHLLD